MHILAMRVVMRHGLVLVRVAVGARRHRRVRVGVVAVVVRVQVLVRRRVVRVQVAMGAGHDSPRYQSMRAGTLTWISEPSGFRERSDSASLIRERAAPFPAE